MNPITRETYLNWYEEMLFWRKFEDKLAAVYIQQKVRGFLHLYNGQEAILPVDTDVRHWHATPRAAAGFLVHAAEMDTSKLNDRITLNMPGLSVTVQEQIDALERVAGSHVIKLIKHQPDPTIQKIVSGWARNFDTKRSIELGFKAETNFDEIIKTYIEDDLKK